MAVMNSTLETPLIWVNNENSLSAALDDIQKVNRIAVDTESNSLYAYQEQVCLIQISTSSKDYLIDCMAGLDLTRLAAIFADPYVEKIFHASEYDILCMKRDFDMKFSHLFDTMQAARILGIEKLGLSNLLEDLFAIDQGKSFQKANWSKRPLTPAMMEYARMDTHYLFKLRDHLEPLLKEKGLLDLAAEDFQRLCAVENNHKQQPLYSHVSGYHRLEPQTLRVLEEICRYRDEQARSLNRPHFKVIGNSAIYAVAASSPKTLAELKNIKEISPKLIDRYAEGLLSAVKKGLKAEPIYLKSRRRPSQAYIDRLDALKNWRKKAAVKMGVQSDIVLPRDILENIAGSNPANEDELQNEMAEIPWRFNHFGGEIMDILDKERIK
jgi:ribonuclease D